MKLNKTLFYSIQNLMELRAHGQPKPTNPDKWDSKRMLNVHEEAGKSTVYIYDEIGFWGISPEDVLGMLEGLEGDRVELRINSPGGNVFDGIAILTTLMALEKPIDAHVDGIAASIASVILMAGDTISMLTNTRIMIHDPHVFTMGNASELRKTAEMLDMVKDDIVTTYLRHATIPEKEIRSLMEAETFIGAKDAVAKGFAQTLVELRSPEKGDKPEETENKAEELALYELEAFA